jgi:hypothetical protein
MSRISSEKAKLIEKHIARLQNIHRTPVCLAQGECEGEIGRSHTISKSQSLSLIAENDHVLVRQANLFASSENKVVDIKRTSINEALAFPGFCNRHDNDLFKSLDESPFMVTAEQLFMQAYRCACREYYFKACQIEASLGTAQIAELLGLPQDGEYKLSPEMEIIKESMYKGMDDAVSCKEKFETRITHKDYRRLQSYVIHSSSSPVLACAGSFFPDYLSNEELLQDFTDFNSNLQSLFVSVIPDDSGIFIVLSFFDDDARAPICFIQDLIATDNLTKRVVWMCLTRLENSALKPSWWDGLPDPTRNNISEALHYYADVFDHRIPSFDRMPELTIDEWEIAHQFWI